MSPNKISKRIVADRLDWIEKMMKEIKALTPGGLYGFYLGSKKCMVGRIMLKTRS